jgi:hypothetical protein
MAYEAETDDSEEYEEACELFESFHGFEPREDSDDIVELDGGDILVYVGELTRIGYETPEPDQKTGIRENLHTFGEKNRNARPLLYVDLDGQIVVLKGEYTFTERGFEDTR